MDGSRRLWVLISVRSRQRLLAVLVVLALAGCDDYLVDGDECFRDINACTPAPSP